jgi:hypothetical protein
MPLQKKTMVRVEKYDRETISTIMFFLEWGRGVSGLNNCYIVSNGVAQGASVALSNCRNAPIDQELQFFK